MHRDATPFEQPDRQRLSDCIGWRAQCRVPAAFAREPRHRVFSRKRAIERRKVLLHTLTYLPLNCVPPRKPARQRVLHRRIHR